MKKIIFSAVFLLFSISHFASAAGVSVGGTRFIYQENKREIDIPIFNSDKEKPFLIQTWVSPFEGEGKTPFIATPPLFRIEPDSNAAARISYVGEPIGSNQEKLYLLNVKSIPPKDVKIENQLQIVINSQFKLFLDQKILFHLTLIKLKLSKNLTVLLLITILPIIYQLGIYWWTGKTSKVVIPFTLIQKNTLLNTA
ncbi:molecular chaperone [Providencia stuartii]|uniref:fimbrial biogenesis chaperone n=1 Tax=Providencia stuartii TaxID=588 RepID=UPI0034DDC3EC